MSNDKVFIYPQGDEQFGEPDIRLDGEDAVYSAGNGGSVCPICGGPTIVHINDHVYRCTVCGSRHRGGE